VHRVLGYEHTLGELTVGNRLLSVDMFPMGIDYRTYSEAGSLPEVQEEVKKIRKRYGQRRIILSSDRLDYTKGIPLRLEAFEAFLEKKPDSRGKVSLILVAVPSRTTIGHYQRLKEEIDGLVGRINGRFGTMDWLPIQYFNTFLPWRSLIAHYCIADVAMLTPLRDGMNLMAKEFVATKTDGTGVLILSETAGAAQELGEAIIVNPNNRGAMVEAIESALAMPRSEQIERNRTMQTRLQRYDVEYWAGDFIQRLECVKIIQQKRSERGLTAEHMAALLSDCERAKHRLFLLDYDGTLVPFAQTPVKASPGESVLRQLAHLAALPGNEVVIISGRDRATMDRWFGSLDVGFVAEHGVWLKERGGEWWMPEPLSGDWKSEIFPILEVYADRTPGTVIEEKEFSLVWHYRRAEPDLGSLRAKELKDDLLHLTANLNLAVIEGNKIVEIKNAMINKGRAALHWVSGHSWDFILALGDDKTDEDLFAALPEGAYSIKIGRGPSKARFNLHSQRGVLSLLEGCAGSSCAPQGAGIRQ
jgi:trehalose 6-phosphate synthase/phosphatase